MATESCAEILGYWNQHAIVFGLRVLGVMSLYCFVCPSIIIELVYKFLSTWEPPPLVGEGRLVGRQVLLAKAAHHLQGLRGLNNLPHKLVLAGCCKDINPSAENAVCKRVQDLIT